MIFTCKPCLVVRNILENAMGIVSTGILFIERKSLRVLHNFEKESDLFITGNLQKTRAKVVPAGVGRGMQWHTCGAVEPGTPDTVARRPAGSFILTSRTHHGGFSSGVRSALSCGTPGAGCVDCHTQRPGEPV